MKTGKKIALATVLGVLTLFILLNIGWFIWRAVKYEPYSRGMEQNAFSSRIVPRYMKIDADGYDYSVKYPDYLSLTGNLCVGLPAASDNPFTDCLIIWPKASGGYQYGVILGDGEQDYQIYVNADGSAVDPENSEIADRFRETIATLFEKANEMWDLQ